MVAVGLGDALTVALGVGVALCVAVGVGEGDGLAVFVAVGVGDGLAEGVLLGVLEGLPEGVRVAPKPLWPMTSMQAPSGHCLASSIVTPPAHPPGHKGACKGVP